MEYLFTYALGDSLVGAPLGRRWLWTEKTTCTHCRRNARPEVSEMCKATELWWDATSRNPKKPTPKGLTSERLNQTVH